MRQILPNGLTVLVRENRAAPVVALQAWVAVGSADETESELGLAHLHEHMLFKGTTRRGPGEIARAVEAAGGDINAWTSFDQTVYHLVLASRFFETGLDILGDAVTDAVFDADELKREIEVVVEEIRRAEDSPSRRVSRDLFSLAFERHPYQRPVLGSETSVRAFTRDGILAFYRRHYRPEQMILAIVGDISPEAAFAAAARSPLGQLPRSTTSNPPTRIAEPPQLAPRACIRTGDVREAHLSLAWHGPALLDKDVAALDLLTVLLGQGESSRLNLVMRRELALVNDVHAMSYTPRDPGLMIASASLPPAKWRAAMAELLAQIYRLRNEEVSGDELAVAKRLIESDAVYQRETVQGQARQLGFYEQVAGGEAFEELYYDRIARATPADLRRVAEQTFLANGLSAVLLLPNDAEVTSEAELLTVAAEAEQRAREIPRSQSTPSTRPTLPRVNVIGRADTSPWHRETLPGGATLLVKQDRAVPLVALRAAWQGGLRAESDANNGAHELLARTLIRGTRTLSADAAARAMDNMAGSFSGQSGRNSFGMRAEFLSRHTEEGFGLFADFLLEPALPAAELERERHLQLEEIRSKDDNPAGVAFDLFARTMFTAHPNRLDALGTVDSLARISDESLRQLLSKRYPASALTLSIVGDIEIDQARTFAAARFGTHSQRVSPLNVAAEPAQTAPRESVQHLQREQAHLVLGYRGLSLADPRRFALEVLSAALGGQGGRLFVQLRDRQSLAYSVSSFSVEGIDPGYFAVYMGTAPSKVPEALAGIRNQLAALTDTTITPAELDRARLHLIGAQAIGLQKVSARAGVAALDDCYGLGYDASTHYAEHVGAVTAVDILNIAQTILVSNHEVLALVTP